MKICIGCDHAGYNLKNIIIDHLKLNYEIINVGTNSDKSVDYPDFAHLVAELILNNKADFGILICGSGNGISMTANKYNNIRAALCWEKEIAKLARLHNDANVLSLPARYISFKSALEIVDVFFNTDFEGGRHQRRLNKINCD